MERKEKEYEECLMKRKEYVFEDKQFNL